MLELNYLYAIYIYLEIILFKYPQSFPFKRNKVHSQKQMHQRAKFELIWQRNVRSIAYKC